jgi:hypothetical protein
LAGGRGVCSKKKEEKREKNVVQNKLDTRLNIKTIELIDRAEE